MRFKVILKFADIPAIAVKTEFFKLNFFLLGVIFEKRTIVVIDIN